MEQQKMTEDLIVFYSKERDDLNTFLGLSPKNLALATEIVDEDKKTSSAALVVGNELQGDILATIHWRVRILDVNITQLYEQLGLEETHPDAELLAEEDAEENQQ